MDDKVQKFMWVTHVGWYQTCWENKKERGRQKWTIKISKIVGNCIYRYTKFKKRNMKIIANSIINIYKQVKKWSNGNKGISFPPQWESKTDLLWSHQRRRRGCNTVQEHREETAMPGPCKQRRRSRIRGADTELSLWLFYFNCVACGLGPLSIEASP